jgi:hypothetical protein
MAPDLRRNVDALRAARLAQENTNKKQANAQVTSFYFYTIPVDRIPLSTVEFHFIFVLSLSLLVLLLIAIS